MYILKTIFVAENSQSMIGPSVQRLPRVLGPSQQTEIVSWALQASVGSMTYEADHRYIMPTVILGSLRSRFDNHSGPVLLLHSTEPGVREGCDQCCRNKACRTCSQLCCCSTRILDERLCGVQILLCLKTRICHFEIGLPPVLRLLDSTCLDTCLALLDGVCMYRSRSWRMLT